jgi:hypothetical protein
MTSPERDPAALLCPSAPPDWADARAIGVVGGTVEAPSVAYLKRSLAVTDDLLRLAEPVLPTEVFRFAAPCMSTGCRHHNGGACGLAEKVVAMLAPATERLPSCTIRATCLWFHQEGRAACLRCPQVVTDNTYPSPDMRNAADPSVPAPRPAAPIYPA